MKPSIFVTRKLPDPAMAKLAKVFDVRVNPHDRVLTKSEIIQGVKTADALLCLLTDRIDGEIMDANPKLRVISNYAVGINNIDLDAATQRKIPVCYTPGVLTETTADLVFALILSVARRIVPAEVYTRAGLFDGWAPELFLGSDVHGKTLGIVGMGRIGLATARRAVGFGMKVLYTKRGAPEPIYDKLGLIRADLDTLLEESDFVSLHVPLTPESRHLIGDRELDKMKSSAYIINTARGPIIDEKALVRALQAGSIAGAGLDVFEEEPKIQPQLLEMENVVLLPHIGSATWETRTKMGVLAAENAIAITSGTEPHAIANPDVLSALTQ
ncbi:MAG: D-glycerate dehydrogenase [Chlamydiia bacterium]|nr:D-glycerate dehydrogenase [Chlamydiia bacterium]